MRINPVLFTLAIGFFLPALQAAPLDGLAKKLAKGASPLENKKIAVLAFPYHDEKISSASTLLSERLTTCLVARKELRVLERRLIEQLLKEKKLGEAGVIDPRSLKTLGKMLDAEAIVTGTLIDLPSGMTEINARLIRVDTGEVLAAGQTAVPRTWTDVPLAIKPTPVVSSPPRKAPPAVAEADASDEPMPAKLSGKSLKLSNNNFPSDRRNPMPMVPATSVMGLLGLQESSEPRFEESFRAPAVFTPVRRGHVGYNGTDRNPLPPTYLQQASPLGTVRTEKRTYSRPSNRSSK